VLLERGHVDEGGDADVRAALADAMKTMRVKDAATMVAGAMGRPRREIYQMALALSQEDT